MDILDISFLRIDREVDTLYALAVAGNFEAIRVELKQKSLDRKWYAPAVSLALANILGVGTPHPPLKFKNRGKILNAMVRFEVDRGVLAGIPLHCFVLSNSGALAKAVLRQASYCQSELDRALRLARVTNQKNIENVLIRKNAKTIFVDIFDDEYAFANAIGRDDFSLMIRKYTSGAVSGDALAAAASQGDLVRVQALVDGGADARAGDDRALILAYRQNRWDVVNYLADEAERRAGRPLHIVFGETRLLFATERPYRAERTARGLPKPVQTRDDWSPFLDKNGNII